MYVDGSKKKLGHIRAFIFSDNNCVGFLIKRPDFLWMFHRKPGFVSLKECTIKKDGVSVKNTKAIVPKNKNDQKLLNWLELPVNFGDKKIGYISRVDFDAKTGELKSIGLSQGTISGMVLGKSEIKAKDIEGYSDKHQAVMVKNGASIYETKKGAAEAAGKATSVVIHKVKKTAPKVVDSMQEQSDKIHNMFHEFKDELKKGMEE